MDTVTALAAPYVRPDVQAFLAMLAQAGGPEMSAMALEEARAAFLAMGAMTEAEPRPLAVIRDLSCPGPAGDIPLRLYDAREAREPGPAVVFYHGGGFVVGNIASHHSMCSEIAHALDLPVVSVDYRLAPEHPFPAAPDDCEAATRWLAESPEALGRAVTGLIPMGDSAGGNLAIVTTQALLAGPAAVPVVLQVPIYPATDGRNDHPSFRDFGEGYLLTRASMDWFSATYAAQEGDPRAFPIHGDHARTAPTVLVTASLDPLRDGGRAYAAQLVLAGTEVVYLEMRGTIHGFANFRKIMPSAQGDVEAMFAAIRLLLGRGGA
jgi:acetyl esterase